MATYYKPTKIKSPFPIKIERGDKVYTLSETERELDYPCLEIGKHKWLLLPKDRIDGKQYVRCLTCGDLSHL